MSIKTIIPLAILAMIPIFSYSTSGSFIGNFFIFSVVFVPLAAVIYFLIHFLTRGKISKNGKDMEMSLNGSVTIKNPFAGIFISGGAGSGKSKSIIEPLIKESGTKGYTGVIYDFKFPELAQYAQTAYNGSNTKINYFNFTDLSRSVRLNPISPSVMTNDSYAREFAFTILANLNPQMIHKPDFWSDNATSFLSAVFLFLKEKHPDKCTLPHAISLILQPDFELLMKKVISVPKCADMIAPLATAFANNANDQLAGVLSTLQVALAKINLEEIYYLMGAEDVSLKVNEPENPSILVIGNNPQLSATYAPLIGLILTSISKQLNRAGKEKSVFMLDEFPTVYVPNIEQLPATARSNKVATILACQDIAQVNDRYGKEKTESILSNLGNQFFGRTPSIETARRVIALFGKTEVVKKSTSRRDFSIKKTTSKSIQEKDIVKPQELVNLNTGTFFYTISEGRKRQGKIKVPIDARFKKSDINQVNSDFSDKVANEYKKIKSEAASILSEQ